MVWVHGTDDAEDTMDAITLKHHKRSENKYIVRIGSQTFTITRRFLASRSVRVRVTATTLAGYGEGNWTDYRDFTDMHEGDAAFHKQANTFALKWEDRYMSTDHKETTVTDDPTQDIDPQPTNVQWAAGATMTPARAAELATRRTGIQHAVDEDGRNICAQPPAGDTPKQQAAIVRRHLPVVLTRKGERALEQREAVDGTFVGRLIGEYTFRVRRSRPSRTEEMGKLLHACAVVVSEWRMRSHALRSQGTVSEADAKELSLMQQQALYFTHLLNAGYAHDTDWDELVEMVKPLVATARRVLPDHRAALATLTGDGQALVSNMVTGAEAFLLATEGVRRFYEDDTDHDA